MRTRDRSPQGVVSEGVGTSVGEGDMNSTATLLSVLALTGCATTQNGRTEAPLTDGGGSGGTGSEEGQSSAGGSDHAGGASGRAGSGGGGGHGGALDASSGSVCPESIAEYCKTHTCQQTQPSDARMLCNVGDLMVTVVGCTGPYAVFSTSDGDSGPIYTYDTGTKQLVLIEHGAGTQISCEAGPSGGLPARGPIANLEPCSRLNCTTDAAP
jgi:hypothetical protein